MTTHEHEPRTRVVGTAVCGERPHQIVSCLVGKQLADEQPGRMALVRQTVHGAGCGGSGADDAVTSTNGGTTDVER